MNLCVCFCSRDDGKVGFSEHWFPHVKKKIYSCLMHFTELLRIKDDLQSVLTKCYLWQKIGKLDDGDDGLTTRALPFFRINKQYHEPLQERNQMRTRAGVEVAVEQG